MERLVEVMVPTMVVRVGMEDISGAQRCSAYGVQCQSQTADPLEDGLGYFCALALPAIVWCGSGGEVDGRETWISVAPSPAVQPKS